MHHETCPNCNPTRYRGRLCTQCAEDYERWDDQQTRNAAAFEAMTSDEYERWLAMQDEHAALRFDTYHA